MSELVQQGAARGGGNPPSKVSAAAAAAHAHPQLQVQDVLQVGAGRRPGFGGAAASQQANHTTAFHR